MTQKRYLSAILMFLVLFTAILVGAIEYKLGPGDVILISVYDHKDLETKVRINENGKIIMPLIGAVEVGGLSISDATEKIRALLADGYIVNPQVNVFVEDYRSKKVVVLGQVNKPGLIELDRATSFLELISKAGGLSKEAGDTATIKRSLDGKTEIITIDLLSLVEKGDLSQNIPIYDGDTVNVSKAGMCFVTGEVKQPGTYKCGEDTTILKIVALSGGFTGKAAKGGVRIVHVVDGKKTLLKDVALDTKLVEDDVIVVPESFF